MIGRTNILFGSGGGSGGSGGVTTVDLPTCPSSLTASPGNGKVTLTLAYSDTDFVSGVEVRYKTDSYPTSPTNGTGKVVTGAATSIEITGLANGTTYYFRVYLYREIDGVKYYQTDDTRSKISCMISPIEISGITPAVIESNYLLINTSGSFKMTIPVGMSITAYLVGGGQNGESGEDSDEDYEGGGGNGGSGGRYYKTSINNGAGSFNCTSSIGNSYAYSSTATPTDTTLKIASSTYSTTSGTIQSGGIGGWANLNHVNGTSGTTGLSTPYGYIGSSGGGGATGRRNAKGGAGGTGAGSGGNGAYYADRNGEKGSSASNYGCGGGGGSGARTSNKSGGSGGAGKCGCIILSW